MNIFFLESRMNFDLANLFFVSNTDLGQLNHAQCNSVDIVRLLNLGLYNLAVRDKLFIRVHD